MLKSLQFQVAEISERTRLDAYILSQCTTSSRALVRDALARGDITVDGRVALKGTKLKNGSIVVIKELLEESDNKIQPESSITPEIIYEDEFLLGIDKPPAIPVHPLSARERGTLLNGVIAKYPQIAEVGDQPLVSGAVHRIDTGTSGLVIIAKDNESFYAMRQAFAERRVVKKYLAEVQGLVKQSGSVACELVHDPTASHCRMIDKLQIKRKSELTKLRPMFAKTEYSPLRTNKTTSLLEVTILTGVTHQIRAQLSMTGHPIVGDTLYGASKTTKKPDSSFHLHSLSAEFIHPITKEPITIATKLPIWAKK